MAKQAVKAETTELKNRAILGTFTGKCCDSEVYNNNDMKLNRDVFETLMASDEYKDAIERGHYIGFLGHPEDPGCQDFKNACIVMTGMEIKSDGEIYGTFDLLDTPVGRIAKTFIDAGVQWGISIRGLGDVDVDGNVNPEYFTFRGFDLVAFPAYNDAMPEFLEIAAASNPKYKKIKATLDNNLQYITSATTLDQIQANLNPHSAEYKKLEARKKDIGTPDETCPECSEEELEEITAKKLRCMTDMYIEECEKNSNLETTLASTRSELKSVKATYERKIRSLKRITASQNQLMTERLQKVVASKTSLEKDLENAEIKIQRITASRDVLKEKNSEIISELDKSNKNNLIYKQKIECSSVDIKDRDAEISDLRERLNKTVVASTNAKREVSNRDAEVDRLKSEVSASKATIRDLESRILAFEDMLHQYQQAYGDIYATALGTSVSGLPVTASTSVRELEHLIQGATNTSNLDAMPTYGVEEDEVVELDDDVNGGDLATL